MKSRYVSAALFALLAILVAMPLMATGSGEAATGTQPAAAATPAGSLPLAAQPVTLRFATHQGTSSSMAPPSNDLPVYKYLEKITNVKIVWETVPYDSYREVMGTRVAAGSDLPDILNLTNLGNYQKLAEDKIIISQNDLIDKYGVYIKMFFAKNPAYKAMMTAPDGNIYCVEDTVLDSHLSIMPMINKYALDRVKMAMPDSADAFYNVLKAFRDKDINGNGKADEVPFATIFNANDPTYIYQLGNAFDLELTWGMYRAKDGKLQCQFQLPEFKALLTYVNKLYTEGLINKDLTSANYDKLIEYTSKGQCGAVSFWSTYAYLFGGASPDNQGDTDGAKVPVFIPAPAFKTASGAPGYYTKRLGLNADGMGITTACTADKRAAAMKWIDFLFNSPEAIMTQSYGVEGISYNKKADGTIEKIAPAGKEWSMWVTEIGGNQPPRAHQQLLDAWRAWMPKWLEDVDASYQQYYKEPSVIAIQWTAAENDELQMYLTDFQTYVNESVVKFVLGQQGLDKFDSFVQELDKRGLPQITKIYEQRYQRQKKALGM